jgi:hypothetical protein
MNIYFWCNFVVCAMVFLYPIPHENNEPCFPRNSIMNHPKALFIRVAQVFTVMALWLIYFIVTNLGN